MGSLSETCGRISGVAEDRECGKLGAVFEELAGSLQGFLDVMASWGTPSA